MADSEKVSSLSKAGEERMKPSAIFREDCFLWQEDTPSGAGINLWSGLLSANNGYSSEHALKAAILFEAAPDLLVALEGLMELERRGRLMPIGREWDAARAAIAKATQGV